MWLSRAEKLLALEAGCAHSTVPESPLCLTHHPLYFNSSLVRFWPHTETGSTSDSSSLASEPAGGLVKCGLLSPKPTASEAPGGREAWEPAFLTSSQVLLLLLTWASHMGNDWPSSTSWFSSKSRVWSPMQVSYSGSSPDSIPPLWCTRGEGPSASFLLSLSASTISKVEHWSPFHFQPQLP